jgi:RNA polymerase sigma-70 factor (ECF subfamily)
VFRYCLRRLFARAVAEDVTGDVFLRVAGHIRSFPGTTEEDFRRWVYRVATNEVNAYVRRTKRRRELLESAVRASAIRVMDGPNGRAHQADAVDWPSVYQAILSLKPREQSIIALRFFEGLSYDEIAGVLDRRPATVRVAMSRALAKLRRRLGAAGDRGTEPSRK